MKLEKKKIGICIPEIPKNSKKILDLIKDLIKRNNIVIAIVDFSVSIYDNINYKNFIQRLENITSNKVITNFNMAESIGKKDFFDILLIAPCTENVIPKLSYNIYDRTTTRLVKYQLINNKPIVLGIFANNGLSCNAENIGKLLNKKNYYFIPFKQYAPITKPYFISFDYSYTIKTLEYALIKKQIQPILLSI